MLVGMGVAVLLSVYPATHAERGAAASSEGEYCFTTQPWFFAGLGLVFSVLMAVLRFVFGDKAYKNMKQQAEDFDAAPWAELNRKADKVFGGEGERQEQPRIKE